jgi:hypothetical protein
MNTLFSSYKKIYFLCFVFLCGKTVLLAQPTDKPCNAPSIIASATPGMCKFTSFTNSAVGYSNFLNAPPACVTLVTPANATPSGLLNYDAWYKIDSLSAGESYNFLYIEDSNRQTFVEVYELPSGADCNNRLSYVSTVCSRSNAVVVYGGTSVSATFTFKNASSTYFLRFQRVNTGSFDISIAGKIAVTKAYPNDEPCGAIPLVPQSEKGINPTLGSNIGAADWKPYQIVGPTCGTNNDVWYKFVANTCSIEAFLKNLSPQTYEIQAAILKNDNKNCSSTEGKFSEMTACGGKQDKHDDIILKANKLTIGETYYIVVDGYSVPYDSAVGNFSIEVFPSAIQDCPIVSSVEDCAMNPTSCTEHDFGLEFFPNPVTETLWVRINTAQQGKFVLYNVLGEKVVSSMLDNSETAINVQHLTKGLYMASVELNGTRFLKKIMLIP